MTPGEDKLLYYVNTFKNIGKPTDEQEVLFTLAEDYLARKKKEDEDEDEDDTKKEFEGFLKTIEPIRTLEPLEMWIPGTQVKQSLLELFELVVSITESDHDEMNKLKLIKASFIVIEERLKVK